MNWVLKQWVWLAGLAVLLLTSGCIGPRYTEYDLLVTTRKHAPKINSPCDPALQANLSTNLWPRQPFLGRAAEVGTTLFKDAGIQGWEKLSHDRPGITSTFHGDWIDNGIDVRFFSVFLRMAHHSTRPSNY